MFQFSIEIHRETFENRSLSWLFSPEMRHTKLVLTSRGLKTSPNCIQVPPIQVRISRNAVDLIILFTISKTTPPWNPLLPTRLWPQYPTRTWIWEMLGWAVLSRFHYFINSRSLLYEMCPVPSCLKTCLLSARHFLSQCSASLHHVILVTNL